MTRTCWHHGQGRGHNCQKRAAVDLWPLKRVVLITSVYRTRGREEISSARAPLTVCASTYELH